MPTKEYVTKTFLENGYFKYPYSRSTLAQANSSVLDTFSASTTWMNARGGGHSTISVHISQITRVILLGIKYFRMRRFLATSACSTVALAVGMMVAVLTTIIGALHNGDEKLSMNDEQASWFGSLMLIVQPIGCVLAGLLQNFIGRKTGMILMNVTALIAWLLLYTASSVEMLYVAAAMMGLSAGLMDAPSLSYIGEVTEPRLRGLMASFANTNVSIGLLLEFFLGSVVDWRTAVAISAAIPVISITMILFIPDSPYWLSGKGRSDEAFKALRWLRGWTTKEEVQAEFDDICQYTQNSAHNTMDRKEVVSILDVCRGAMLRPFLLIVCYQFFYHCVGLSGPRGYMIEVFKAFEVPVRPQWLIFMSSIFMILGGVFCVSTVKFMGKRKMSLCSMLLSAVLCILLGAYSHFQNAIQLPWVPLALFCSLYFWMMFGIGTIPWMLVCEIFPMRGRDLGTGVSAAMFYVIAFFLSKTYLNVKYVVGLSGCFYLYGVTGLLGFVFLFVCLPETEGKTLAEIERHFSKKKKMDSLVA